MRKILKILLIVMLITSFSAVVHAQRAEYKKLNQRMALLYRNGRLPEAIKTAEELIKVAENTFGTNHAYVISSMNNLALLYFKNEEYENAKSCYEKALIKTENLVGKTHPNIIKVLEDIKKCCRELGKSAEVNDINSRLENLRRTISG